MNKKTIKISVVPSSGVKGYWVAVSEADVVEVLEGAVEVLNQSVYIDLDPEREHILFWWFVGEPGASIKIVGSSNNKEYVSVKNSQIPSGELEGGGRKRFKIDIE